MKYVKQVLWIIGFTFAGEALHAWLPLPVPAGVYGLFLMLGGLLSGLIKLSDVEESGNFLLDTMTMMFIPAGVAVMNSFQILAPVVWQYALIIVASTIFVMGLTGLCAQWILDRTESPESRCREKQETEPENTVGIAHLNGGGEE